MDIIDNRHTDTGSTMNKLKKRLFLTIALIVISSLLGSMLLTISYLLPVAGIHNNVENSLDIFKREGVSYTLMDKNQSSWLDNTTDIVYLNIALGDTKDGIIKNVFSSYLYSSKDEDAIALDPIVEYFESGEDNLVKRPLGVRFWNGYLIFLKPLLEIFDYSDIRQLNVILELFIIVAVCCLLCIRNLKTAIIPFISIILFMNPISMMLNIFFSGIFYCAFIPIIIMLVFNKTMVKKKIYYGFFCIIGILTIFFNMNSFQLITFGIPCLFYFVINGCESLKHSLYKMIDFWFGWFLGYAGMMLSKWLIAELFTDINVYEVVRFSLQQRFSNQTSTEVFSRMSVLNMIDSAIKSNTVWCIFEIAFLIMCICLIIRYRPAIKAYRNWMCLGLILSCFPMMRFFIMANHSYIHWCFVYRICSITVFAWNYIFASLSSEGIQKTQKRM